MTGGECEQDRIGIAAQVRSLRVANHTLSFTGFNLLSSSVAGLFMSRVA